LENNVFHFAATQVLYTLFTQNPRDCVSHVALATAIWAYDGCYSVSSEDYLCVVGEGFKASYFQALKFEHAVDCSILGASLSA
jgi:hypothetical protein